jgi:hypothetical protein
MKFHELPSARVQSAWGRGALPPNKAMELTSEIVTPFAFAKGAPISAAAHRQR